MDLIDRKAAIEEFEKMVTSVSVYGESAEARYANNARLRFIEKLADIPSIPAVPLDKLCEWLEENALDITQRNVTPMKTSAEHWERVLTNWMEGLDAKK